MIYIYAFVLMVLVHWLAVFFTCWFDSMAEKRTFFWDQFKEVPFIFIAIYIACYLLLSS